MKMQIERFRIGFYNFMTNIILNNFLLFAQTANYFSYLPLDLTKIIVIAAIATAAIEMLTGDTSTSRKPEIVSDAAYVMLCKYVWVTFLYK